MKTIGTVRSAGRVVPLSPRRRLALSLGVLVAAAALAWLDSPASPLALHAPRALVTATVFSAIWTGIQILAGWVATAAEVTATYVWIALQWLAASVGTFLKSTGAMFAKVWDGMKIVWSDVLRPALVWIDDHLKRLYAWLQQTFKPVFDFLRHVRERLHAFYATFVRPVVDTIEFVRQINRVLLAFHIDLLQSLDKTLQQIEQRIEEPFLWLEKKLNEVWNALELVVTLDGFFQRLTLVRSLSRYAPDWMNGFWNRQLPADGFSGDEHERTRDYPLDAAETYGQELAKFYRGDDSNYTSKIPPLVLLWRVAAGIDPPGSADG